MDLKLLKMKFSFNICGLALLMRAQISEQRLLWTTLEDPFLRLEFSLENDPQSFPGRKLPRRQSSEENIRNSLVETDAGRI